MQANVLCEGVGEKKVPILGCRIDLLEADARGWLDLGALCRVGDF